MLDLIQKLSTAMRGGAREVLETAVDANATRIFAQEIHECETGIRQAKQHLTGVVAEKLKLQRQIDAQAEKLEIHASHIQEALAQQNEQRAMELAEVMAREEEWQQELHQQHKKLEDYEQRLMQSLKTTAHKLEQYRAELRMAKATEQAQQAAGKLSKQANLHSDRFAQMQDSLERIKQRQTDFADQMQAAEEVDAGLSSRPTEKQRIQVKAEEVLARFKAA